jgi:hypothetical protein
LLCGSLLFRKTTTETQSTQRLHREESVCPTFRAKPLRAIDMLLRRSNVAE